MEKIADRLARKMKELDLTQYRLWKDSGIPQPTIKRILDGTSKQPDKRTVEALAAALGTSYAELYDGIQPAPNVGKMPRPGEAWDNEDELDEADYAFAPRMDMSVPCGDGKPMFHIDEKGQRQAFRRSWLNGIGANPATVATITADGDSMAPRIQDQDSLVIDYGQKLPKDGKVFVITYQDEWYIKRIFKKPGGGIRIVSDNPDKNRYPDWDLDAHQMDEFMVIAKVVALSGAVD